MVMQGPCQMYLSALNLNNYKKSVSRNTRNAKKEDSDVVVHDTVPRLLVDGPQIWDDIIDIVIG